MWVPLLIHLLVLRLSVCTTDLLEGVQCDEDPLGYVVPDPNYCDRYLECGPGSGGRVQLCPHGQALDLNTGLCLETDIVDCGTREMMFQQRRIRIPSSFGFGNILSRSKPIQATTRPSLPARVATTATTTTTTTEKTTITPEFDAVDLDKPKLDLFGSRRRSNFFKARTTTIASRRTPTEDIVVPSPTNRPQLPQRSSKPTEIKTENDEHSIAGTSFIRHRTPIVRTRTTTTPRPLFNRISKTISPSTSESRVSIQKSFSQFNLEKVVCEGSDKYFVHDSKYCDRYLSCPSGKIVVCMAGKALDLRTGICQSKAATDCSGRELSYRDVQEEEEQNKRFEDEMKEIMAKTRNEETRPNYFKSGVTSSIETTITDLFNPDLVSSSSLPSSDPMLDLTCDPGEEYVVPDPEYCDRYLSCPEGQVEICQRGLVIDQDTGYCQRRRVTDCSGREKLFRDVEEELETKLAEKVRKLEETSSTQHTLHKPLDNTNSIRTPPSSSRSLFARKQVSVDNSPGRSLGKSIFSASSSTAGISNTVTPPPSLIPLSDLICEASEDSYIVHDPEQCDRFAECSVHGEKFYKVCPIGLVFSLTKGVCDYPDLVDCTTRPKLQSSLGRAVCPERDGQFAVDSDATCKQYVDCRGGEGFIQSCGAAGQVFDEHLGCVHHQQSNRPGCSNLDQNEFQCPVFGYSRQKFGDQARHPHHTDCKLFYSCSKQGQKRLLGCEKPTVFNPVTGLCDAQENVPGCEGYYVTEAAAVDAGERSKIAEEIRKQLIKEFGLRRN